jgi:uncharacterized protein (UPF0210 family)
MSKVVIELEINGDAKEFINGLIEDYYYTAKSDKDLLAQYESLKFTIKEPLVNTMTAADLAAIVDSSDSFAAYVKDQDTHADNVAVSLIGVAYELDGEELNDEEMLETIEEILDSRRHYISRNY